MSKVTLTVFYLISSNFFGYPHIFPHIPKGSYIKDVRKRGGIKQKRTPADMGGGGVKQNWTSIFGSSLISI